MSVTQEHEKDLSWSNVNSEDGQDCHDSSHFRRANFRDDESIYSELERVDDAEIIWEFTMCRSEQLRPENMTTRPHRLSAQPKDMQKGNESFLFMESDEVIILKTTYLHS